LVETRIDDWDAYRLRSGATAVDSVETTSNAIPINRSPNQSVNQVTCVNGVPTSMTLGATDTIALANLAKHEAGHTHRLHHSGPSDSDPFFGVNGRPVMTTCVSPTTEQSITSDDRAALSREWDGAITANGGFENSQGWAGAGYFRSSENPAQGSFHARVNGEGYVRSTPTRFTTPPATLRVRATYKNGGSTSRLKFEYRTVNYGTGLGCAGANYNPDTFNWDTPSAGPWIFNTSVNLPTSTSYTTRAATVTSPTPGSGFSAFEGVDVRVQYYVDPGSTGFVDNLEVY